MAAGDIGDGTKAVTAAGTAEQLTTTSTVVDWVVFSAHDDNTGQMMVGASTVVATGGATARGGRIPIPAATLNEVLRLDGPLNLDQFYVDAEVNGDGVSYIYRETDQFGG